MPGSEVAGSASMNRLIPDTVGASKNVRSGTATRAAACTRARSCIASRECPPSSKKLSKTPTRSILRSCLQIPATISSVGLRGATNGSSSRSRRRSGAGRARRSALPLGVSGIRSTTTNAAGIMYAGRRPCRNRRRAFGRGASCGSGTMYATRIRSPGASSHATTMACRMAGCRSRATSTSRSSAT